MLLVSVSKSRTNPFPGREALAHSRVLFLSSYETVILKLCGWYDVVISCECMNICGLSWRA